MKYEIVERKFTDYAEAFLFTQDNLCVGAPRQSGEEWLVFELVPVMNKFGEILAAAQNI